MKPLPFLFFLLLSSALHAQECTYNTWRPLTDSVFMVLHLSEDQVHRVRAIDAHYTEERYKVQASGRDAGERERTLSGLIAEREKEVQGVMTHDQFERWIGKARPAPAKPAGRR